MTISFFKINCLRSKDARLFFKKNVFTSNWSYKNVGFKKNKWVDVILMQKKINAKNK